MSVVRKINSGRQATSEEEVAQSDKPSPAGKYHKQPITDSDAYPDRDPVVGSTGSDSGPESKGSSGPYKSASEQPGRVTTKPGKVKSGVGITGSNGKGKVHGSSAKAKHMAAAMKAAHASYAASVGIGGHFSDGQNSESDNPFNGMNPLGREPEATPIGDMHPGNQKHTASGKTLSPSTKKGKNPKVKYAAAGGND